MSRGTSSQTTNASRHTNSTQAGNDGSKMQANAKAGMWTVPADLARVFRIPGTYNCKTEPPVEVTVLQNNECRYEPTDFEDWIIQPASHDEQQPKHQEGVNTLPLSDRIRYLIKHGDTLGRYASRSEAIFAVITAMIRARHNPDDICAALLDPDNAISDLPIEKGERWLRQEIERAYGKGATPLDRLYDYIKAIDPEDASGFRDRFDQAFYGDITNGKHLVREYGDNIHYVHAWKEWIVYEYGIWRRDESGVVDRYAKSIVADIGKEG